MADKHEESSEITTDPEAVTQPGSSDDAGETDPEAVSTEAELEEFRDRYLRLAAEYDNFRKRTARQRLEDRDRAQGEIIGSLLDTLDDLTRVESFDPAQAAVEDVIAGVQLVDRKLQQLLGAAGLERVGDTGEAFDPNRHEAVASTPAPSPEQDHTIAAVFQVGYRFKQQLLRPARVQVFVWMDLEPAPDEA
jgi:molecular chaperone GrpE